MSIAALLQAAEYLDRREREAEHGYASTIPYTTCINNRSRKTVMKKVNKSQGNRSTHNELEKNRRAHLRTCLEGLKAMVPLAMESSRHTTLGLLTKAKSFIKILEDREKKHSSMKDQLLREQRYLRRRVEHLINEQNLIYRVRNERSCSECSSNSAVSSTGSTSTSSPSPSESDEVDILGYYSNQSDTEDVVKVPDGSDIIRIDSRLTIS